MINKIRNIFRKETPSPTCKIVLCEECYFPKLNTYVRAHAPDLWDKWVEEGIENSNLKEVKL